MHLDLCNQLLAGPLGNASESGVPGPMESVRLQEVGGTAAANDNPNQPAITLDLSVAGPKWHVTGNWGNDGVALICMSLLKLS